jgi:hypothetical protein
MLSEGAKQGDLHLSLAPDEHGRLALSLTRDNLTIRHTAHLSPEEFDTLATRSGVTEVLETHGISWR